MNRYRFHLLVLLALGCMGCADNQAAQSAVTREDSAGVEIVRHPVDVLSGLPVWTLAGTPLVEIGDVEGEEEYQFFGISAGARLPGDTVLVVNGGSRELRFYDVQGRFIRGVGREGEGPGEFGYPAWLGRIGDSLLVWDSSLRRLSFFDLSGTFLGHAMTDRQTANPRFLGVFSDHTFIVKNDRLQDLSDQFQLMYTSFLRFGLDGHLVDTLPRQPWSLLGDLGDSGFIGGPVFGFRTSTAADSASYWVGTGEEPEVKRYTPAGRLTQVVRWPDGNRSVSQAAVDHYWEGEFEGAEGDHLRRLEVVKRSRPPAEFYPVFDDLHSTREGGLWIHLFRPPGTDGPERWLVLAPTGTLTASIELPESLRILEIGPGYLLAVRPDEFEVEHLVLYSVVR